MENNKKNNGVIVGLLIGIIIMLVVFVALFATNTISFTSKTATNNIETNNTEENIVSYSYKQLEGLYSYTEEESDGDLAGLTHNLYLYSNGTYVYRLPARARYGEIGNYIIDGDEIDLNSLFSFGSGVGITTKFESKKLTIQSLTELKIDNATLTKNDTEVEEFSKNYDFKNFIDNNSIDNKYSETIRKNS